LILVSQDFRQILEISFVDLKCHSMKFANHAIWHNFYSNNLFSID